MSACGPISCHVPCRWLFEKTCQLFKKRQIDAVFSFEHQTFDPDLERLERLDLDCWVGFIGPPPLYYLILTFLGLLARRRQMQEGANDGA